MIRREARLVLWPLHPTREQLPCGGASVRDIDGAHAAWGLQWGRRRESGSPGWTPRRQQYCCGPRLEEGSSSLRLQSSLSVVSTGARCAGGGSQQGVSHRSGLQSRLVARLKLLPCCSRGGGIAVRKRAGLHLRRYLHAGVSPPVVWLVNRAKQTPKVLEVLLAPFDSASTAQATVHCISVLLWRRAAANQTRDTPATCAPPRTT